MFTRIKKFVNDHPVEIATVSIIAAAVTSIVIVKKMSPPKDCFLLAVPIEAINGMIEGGNAVLFDVDPNFSLMVNYIKNHG